MFSLNSELNVFIFEKLACVTPVNKFEPSPVTRLYNTDTKLGAVQLY